MKLQYIGHKGQRNRVQQFLQSRGESWYTCVVVLSEIVSLWNFLVKNRNQFLYFLGTFFVLIGVTRELREERPSSKIVTITSFSVIKGRGEPYESSVFEAAGYKW